MPTSLSSQRTSASTAINSGPNNLTNQYIGRATASAMRSGALNAAVFGKISENTTTMIVITTVA